VANKLSDLQVNEVSLVKSGAIGEKFTIIKSADPVSTIPENQNVEKTGLLGEIKKAITGFFDKISKKKSFTNFKDAIAEKEVKNTFYEAFWILDDIVWNIFNDDLIIDKVSAVAAAITDFKEYIIAQLSTDSGVTKMKEVQKSYRELQKVEKVGKKVSSARLAQLKNVIDIVSSIVSDAESEGTEMTTVMDGGGGEVSKSTKGGEKMTPEDIQKALEAALGPVVNSISDIAAKVTKMEEARKEAPVDPAATPAAATTTDPVVKENSITAEQITDIVNKSVQPIAKSIDEISGRVKKLEETPFPSNAIPAGASPVGKSVKWPTFAAKE
jgi:hypothetical protein